MKFRGGRHARRKQLQPPLAARATGNFGSATQSGRRSRTSCAASIWPAASTTTSSTERVAALSGGEDLRRARRADRRLARRRAGRAPGDGDAGMAALAAAACLPCRSWLRRSSSATGAPPGLWCRSLSGSSSGRSTAAAQARPADAATAGAARRTSRADRRRLVAEIEVCANGACAYVCPRRAGTPCRCGY